MIKKHSLILIILIMMSLLLSSCSDKTEVSVESTVSTLHKDGIWIDDLDSLLEDVKNHKEGVSLLRKTQDDKGIETAGYTSNQLNFSLDRSTKEDMLGQSFSVYTLKIYDKSNGKKILKVEDVLDYRFIDVDYEKEFLVYFVLDELNINKSETSIHILDLTTGEASSVAHYKLSGQYNIGNKVYLNALDENDHISLALVNYIYLGNNSDAWLLDIFKFDGHKFNMINEKGGLGVTSMQRIDSYDAFEHIVQKEGDIDKYKYLLKEVSGDFSSGDSERGNVKYVLGDLNEDKRELFNAFDVDGDYENYVIEDKIVKVKDEFINEVKVKFVEIIEREFSLINEDDKEKENLAKDATAEIELFLKELLENFKSGNELDKEIDYDKIISEYRKVAYEALNRLGIRISIAD